MNTEFENNGHAGPGSDIKLSEQRAGADRRDIDRRVCDRRELGAAEAQEAAGPTATSDGGQNRRASDRRGGDRRTTSGRRRSNDATPPPLGYELRLEPRGPGGNRKVSEITTTLSIPVQTLRENRTATLDRLAREFHQEVIEHFRQHLPQVQLLRATVDCISPVEELTNSAADEAVEITLRATCLCRRKPNAGRKSGTG